MSSIHSNRPLLYLPLTALEGNTLRDRSGNGLDGKVNGEIRLLPDDRFGAVVALDGGGRISVPAGNTLQFGDHDFTLALWVRTRQGQSNDQQDYLSILEAWDGLNGGFPYALRLDLAHGTLRAQRYDQTPAAATVVSTQRVDDGEFHHLAFVKRGPTLELYIDGQLDARAPDGTTGATINGAQLTLGMNGAPGMERANPFSGELAHLRIYDSALRSDQIRRDMVRDETSVAAWSRSSPIDFNLCNDAGLAVIQVAADPAGQRLTLNVRNTSGQELCLVAPAERNAPVGFDNHHLSLWFRPGTLSDESLVRLSTPTDGWAMSTPQVQSDGMVVVYLLARDGLPLMAGDGIAILLDNLSGAPGGNRTTRVELGYRQIAYTGSETVPLSGSRSSVMSVVNAPDGIGRIAPLAGSFPTGAALVNDGATVNRLELRLANLSPVESVAFSGAGSARQSRLRLAFDAAPGDDFTLAPWAFATAAQIRAIAVRCDGWAVEGPSDGERPTWTLIPNDDLALAPGASLIIHLENIVTSAPDGQTCLYLAHEDLPGHGNGGTVGVCEKHSPVGEESQEAWQTPVLDKSCKNYGSTYSPAGYFKDSNGMVFLRGVVQCSVSLPHLIFTLPVGYRPPYTQMFPVITHDNKLGRLDVFNDGSVKAQSGESSWISLDGIVFRAER